MPNIYSTFQQSYKASKDDDIGTAAIRYLEGMKENIKLREEAQYNKYVDEYNKIVTEYGSDLGNLNKGKITELKDKLITLQGDYSDNPEIKEKITTELTKIRQYETGEQTKIEEYNKLQKISSQDFKTQRDYYEEQQDEESSVKGFGEWQKRINELNRNEASNKAELKLISDFRKSEFNTGEKYKDKIDAIRDRELVDYNDTHNSGAAIGILKQASKYDVAITKYKKDRNWDELVNDVRGIYDTTKSDALYRLGVRGYREPEEIKEAIDEVLLTTGDESFDTIKGVRELISTQEEFVADLKDEMEGYPDPNLARAYISASRDLNRFKKRLLEHKTTPAIGETPKQFMDRLIKQGIDKKEAIRIFDRGFKGTQSKREMESLYDERLQAMKDETGLKVGTIDDGYEYLGGSPSDKNNWEKVQ